MFSQEFKSAFIFERVYSASVMSDAEGNIYVCGYDKTHNIGSYYGSTGYTEYHILKFNPGTAQVVWNKTISCSIFLRVLNPCLYKSRVLIGGQFKNDISVDSIHQKSAGASDIFLVELSADGSVILKTEGGLGDEEVGSFTVANSGEMYYSGRATGNIVLGSKVYNTGSSTDFYLMKKDSSFNEVWTKVGKTIPGNYSAWGMNMAIFNDEIYLNIGGRSVMENTTDTIGCYSSCDYLYRFDEYGTLIKELNSIVASPGGWEVLSFVDEQNNIYYSNSLGQFIKMTSEESLIWTKPFRNSSTVSFSLNNFSSVLRHNDQYIISENGKEVSDNQSHFYLIRGFLNNGEVLQTYKIPTSKIAYGRVMPYVNNQFLFYGWFNDDSLQLGNNKIYSVDQQNIFVAIMSWSDITNINKSQTIAELKFYPNPTDETVFFNLKDFYGKIAEIEIFDLFGNNLMTPPVPVSATSMSLELKGFASGIYLVKLRTDVSVYTGRIVKN